MFKLKKDIIFNTLLLTIVLLVLSIFASANGNQELANQLFKEGKYEQALPLFESLNQLYPNDETIQYSYGVCLTETNHYGQKAKKLLLQVSQNNMFPDVLFYIGKNYHAQQDFETAMDYYQRFEEKASKKMIKKVELKGIMEACVQNLIPFELPANTSDEISKPIPPSELKISPIEVDSKFIHEQDAMKVNALDSNEIEIIEKEPLFLKESKPPEPILRDDDFIDTTINFMPAPEIRYLKIDQFRTDEGRNQFINGKKKSMLLDDLLAQIGLMRAEFINAENEEQRTDIANKILDSELRTIQLKTESDESFLKSSQAEQQYWKNASRNEIEKLKAQNDSIEAAQFVIVPVFIPEEELLTDAEINTSSEFKNDSIYTENTDVTSPEVIENKNKIIYRVQIGTFKGLPEQAEKMHRKLSVLRKIDHFIDDKGVTVYTIGELTHLKDAIKLQEQIRTEGVKDAFVVAYNNGKRITLKEAKELNQE